MKVVLVMTHGRVHGHVGGAPRVFFDMANHLSNSGYEVMAIYNDNREGSPYYEVEKKVKLKNLALSCKFKGIWIYKLQREIIRSLVKVFSLDLRFNPVNKKKQERVGLCLDPLISTFKPDVIIAYNVSDLVSLSKVKWQAKNTITMCHTDPQRVYLGLADYERVIWKHCDAIQVLLPSYKEYLSGVMDCNIKVIGNVVKDHDEISELSTLQIIYLARIEKNKRQHLIIEAMHRIPKDVRFGWNVALYGSCNDSEYQKFLISKIEEYNLGDVVHLKGATNTPFNMLRQSSICAFPSAFEGFPLALTEAMSFSLPCIGFSSCSGVNELIIDKDNGFLVEDIDDFSSQLELLMESKECRESIGLKGKESVSSYSEKSIFNEWKQLIENK